MDDSSNGELTSISTKCWRGLGRIVLSAAVVTSLTACPDTRPQRNPPTVPTPKMAPGAAPAQQEATPPAAPGRPSLPRE